MALIKCMECGKEVSDRALSCPNCGCPIAQNSTPKDELKEKVVNEIRQIYERVKQLPPKTLGIIVAIFTLLIIFLCIPNGVEKDKATLEKYLLEPDSLIIYQAYTNDNYNDSGRATLFYFGAKNKSGGISDDWALVFDGGVQFQSNFDEAVDNGDNQEVLDNADIVEAKFAATVGVDNWKEVEVD